MSRYGVLLLLIFSLFFTSCVTKKVWSPVSYKEALSSPLISEDGKKLAVIGKRHHYVFDLDRDLKELLLSKQSEQFTTFFDTFEVDKQNKVVTTFAIYYSVDKSQLDQNKRWIKQKGFVWSGVDPLFATPTEFYKTFRLEGKRYLAGDIKNAAQATKDHYCVMVEEADFQYSTSERLLMTPLSVAADGVLIVGGAVLFVVVGGNAKYTLGKDKYKEISCNEKNSR